MNAVVPLFTLPAIVLVVLFLEKRPPFHRLFHYLPAPFWCYFIPMLFTTVGLLPHQSSVYGFLTSYVLCACLLLLLLNVNVPAIARLGPTALGAMTAGTAGIMIGAVVAYSLLAHGLPAEAWKGVSALSASWTGGSANMLAVKEALAMSDHAFAPYVIVDTLTTYSWMGLLIALAPFQERWDRWVRADLTTLQDAVSRISSTIAQPSLHDRATSHWHGLWLVGLGILIGGFCLKAAQYLPPLGSAFSASGWAFILVTLVGTGLSFTPAARLERFGASRWGYFCLYLLLAAIGARAQLQAIWETPFLLVFALMLLAIHATILLTYGKVRRLPMFFLVTASQANIGGTASAPVVAGIYQPLLAPVGLLLAIAANVVGTYLGLIVSHACRLASR